MDRSIKKNGNKYITAKEQTVIACDVQRFF